MPLLLRSDSRRPAMLFVHTPRSLAWMLAPLLAAGLAAGCGTHTGQAAAQGAAATHAATTPDTIAQTSWTLTRWTSASGQPRPVQAATSDIRTPGQANPRAPGKPSRPDTETRAVTLDFLAQGKDYRAPDSRVATPTGAATTWPRANCRSLRLHPLEWHVRHRPRQRSSATT